jgi:hypothetical protein
VLREPSIVRAGVVDPGWHHHAEPAERPVDVGDESGRRQSDETGQRVGVELADGRHVGVVQRQHLGEIVGRHRSQVHPATVPADANPRRCHRDAVTTFSAMAPAANLLAVGRPALDGRRD